MKIPKDKFILDVCCGGRMFWFNKRHPNTIYIDIRKEKKGFFNLRPNFEINPDKIMDFKDLKFPDRSFKLIVFDPPHCLRNGINSIMGKRYGTLNRETWKIDISKGFRECWRVLKDYGTLIFKWNSTDIPLKKVLNLFQQEALFGHPSGSKNKTTWLCFIKIPGVEKQEILE